MGGRGASSGISDKGNSYGSQYHTVLKSGNIKFVEANDRHSESLFETQTKGRVYATVGGNDLLKIIYYKLTSTINTRGCNLISIMDTIIMKMIVLKEPVT